MVTAPRRPARMVQALTILTALQMFSDGGVVPPVEATGEPYGISRDMVEGAARAANAFSTSAPPGGRGLDAIRPVPALSQVTPTITPDSGVAAPHGGAAADPADNEIGHTDSLPLVPERTACNAGLGEMRFEKLPDVRLAPNSYDSDVIRKNAMPSAVLALCEDRCLKDRTATQQLTRRCGSIDFVPGRRYSSYSDSVEYTETKCFLSQPQEETGSSSRAQFERADNYAHLREVCFSSTSPSGSPDSVLRRECPDRLYVMERLLAKRFLPKNAVEVGASSMEACQSMCLHQQSEDPQNATTICRSGTWDRGRNRCFLSSYTRRTHPAEFVDDPDMDYFENTCLSPERRCPKNRLFYLREVNAEMGGPFDLVTFVNVTLDQCQEKCIESKTIFCRSLEYDQRARHCVLSDEDSVSRREEIRASTSSDNVYMELKCFDGDNVKGEYLFEAEVPLGSSNTEQLNARAFRDVRTAFQLYRNRHLELRSGFRDSRRERSLLTLAECLDECLEERTFACRSVMYSQRFQICRLSEYDQYNGELIYDGEYDYFENLMGSGSAGAPPPGRANSNAGSAFGDTRNGIGSNSDSFGGFGGSTADRFSGGSTADRFSGGNSADRFAGSTDDRFGGSTGDRLGGTTADRFRGTAAGGAAAGSTSSRVDPKPERPSLFGDERPGLFRPISTDFNDRDTFNSNSNRGTANRNTATFGGSRAGGSFGGGTGSDRFGGGSSAGFGSSAGSRNRFDFRDNDRFGTGGSLGTGRFSGTGTDLSSNLFGTLAGTNTGFGGSGALGGGGSGGSFGLGGGSGGVSTSSLGTMAGEVAQSCNEDGSMEFTLRTEDPFRGRIYAYGYYDRCFFVGRGSTVSVLQLSAPRGFPDCGTVRYGDSMTNIVVVQFSENVQTMMDKRYNLTCTTIGPSDSVVTSGYIGAGGAGAPTPIEYLELENRLDHRVALRVLYDGRPTTTIAVGDPLTFRLEPQAGYNLVSDIFATNVVAKDPYSGRAVQLIDSRGCPVDNYIFPALGRARSGDGLETRFSAFKIPESNFLVFEANVRPCKNQCTPAFCRDTHGRGEVESFGRRRRSLEDQLAPVNETSYVNMTHEEQQQLEQEKLELEDVPMEHVHGIYEVYLSRDDIPVSAESRFLDEVCLSSSSYHGLMVATVSSILCLVLVLLAAWLLHRRQSKGGVAVKNARADASNPQRALHQESSRSAFPGAHPRTVPQPARYFPDPKPDELALPTSDAEGSKPTFVDPSEPIYTDPTLFERASSTTGSNNRGFQV